MRTDFEGKANGYYRREQDQMAASATVRLNATYREAGKPTIELRLLDPAGPEGNYRWSAGYFISPEEAQELALWLLEKATLANAYVQEGRRADASRSAAVESET